MRIEMPGGARSARRRDACAIGRGLRGMRFRRINAAVSRWRPSGRIRASVGGGRTQAAAPQHASIAKLVAAPPAAIAAPAGFRIALDLHEKGLLDLLSELGQRVITT